MIFSKLFKKCQDYPGFSKNKLPMISDFLFFYSYLCISLSPNLWKIVTK